jgi:hypothetical protein
MRPRELVETKVNNAMLKGGFATVEAAMAAEDLIAKAFGCIADDGHTWRANFWERAESPELLESDDLALRNAARVLVSEERHPWERIAIAAKILRRYGAAS